MFNFIILISTIFLKFPLNQKSLMLFIQINLSFDYFKFTQRSTLKTYLDLELEYVFFPHN